VNRPAVGPASNAAGHDPTAGHPNPLDVDTQVQRPQVAPDAAPGGGDRLRFSMAEPARPRRPSSRCNAFRNRLSMRAASPWLARSQSCPSIACRRARQRPPVSRQSGRDGCRACGSTGSARINSPLAGSRIRKEYVALRSQPWKPHELGHPLDRIGSGRPTHLARLGDERDQRAPISRAFPGGRNEVRAWLPGTVGSSRAVLTGEIGPVVRDELRQEQPQTRFSVEALADRCGDRPRHARRGVISDRLSEGLGLNHPRTQ
jgi:hypothetical protein